MSAGEVVFEPIKVTTVPVTIEKVMSSSPLPFPRTRGRSEERAISHALREATVDEIELRIQVVAAKRETRDSIEIGVRDDKLLAFILAAIMPDACTGFVVTEEP